MCARRYSAEAETPYWGAIVTESQEVVFTHNFGFRPTGIMREAYVAYLNDLYAREAEGNGYGEDVSLLKINEINSWMGAWTFMERCGFRAGEASGDDEADNDRDNCEFASD